MQLLTQGQRIKQARKWAGVSRSQAAKLLNTNTEIINAVEQDRLEAVGDSFERFAELYDVSAAWLATGKTKALDVQMIKEIEKLPPGDRERLQALLEALPE